MREFSLVRAAPRQKQVLQMIITVAAEHFDLDAGSDDTMRGGFGAKCGKILPLW